MLQNKHGYDYSPSYQNIFQCDFNVVRELSILTKHDIQGKRKYNIKLRHSSNKKSCKKENSSPIIQSKRKNKLVHILIYDQQQAYYKSETRTRSNSGNHSRSKLKEPLIESKEIK